mgnify:CR=1 FL=1
MDTQDRARGTNVVQFERPQALPDIGVTEENLEELEKFYASHEYTISVISDQVNRLWGRPELITDDERDEITKLALFLLELTGKRWEGGNE